MFYKFLFLLLSLFCYTIIHANRPLVASVALGLNHYYRLANQNILISDTIFDSMVNAKQKTQPSFSLGLQTLFNIQNSTLDSLLLGPVIYYQQARFSGDIYELNDIEFYNYRYKLSADVFNVFLESNLYFKPILYRIAPFISLGLGTTFSEVRYQDFALPGIAPQTGLLLPSNNNSHFAEIVGAGLAIKINPSLAFQTRYNYINGASAYSSTGNLAIKPIRLSLDNHGFYLGLSFKN